MDTLKQLLKASDTFGKLVTELLYPDIQHKKNTSVVEVQWNTGAEGTISSGNQQVSSFGLQLCSFPPLRMARSKYAESSLLIQLVSGRKSLSLFPRPLVFVDARDAKR